MSTSSSPLSPGLPVSLSVLVVDDDEANRALLRAVLEAEGIRVREAADGRAALDALETEISDAVITDILMPRMDGYRLCHELRANARWRGVSIIVYTSAYMSVSDEKLAHDLGADAFLRKPCSAGEVLAALRRAEVLGEERDLASPAVLPAVSEFSRMQEYSERLVANMEARSAELASAHALLRDFFENSQDLIMAVGPDSRIVSVNRMWRETLGYTEQEAAQLTLMDLVHPDSKERCATAFRRLAGGESLRCFEADFRGKQGQLVRVEGSAICRFVDGWLAGVHCIWHDVTAHKQLQAQYLRSQRMECVGRLSSGLAHDLNNILAPITMGVALLRMDPAGAGNRRTLDLIEKSAERGAGLIKRLLLFSRGTSGDPKPLELKDVVHEAADILRATLPSSVELGIRLPKDLALVAADPIQIQQILVNLCLNARDAMPDGGTLTLSGANVRLDAGSIPPAPPGGPNEYVAIQVTDTGTGIDPAIGDRVFDPFFTTKPNGKSAGLGLSTVKDLAESYGGFVRVESVPGQGATFSIFLPALAKDPVPQVPAVESMPPPGNGEAVLVVDDEDAIRSTLSELLQTRGYTVHTATNGIEGLTLFHRHAATLRLVIADLIMPRMGGLAMGRIIRALRPEMPIVITAGTAGGEQWPAQQREIERLGVSALVPKPFSAQAILGILQNALNKKAA